MSNSYFILVMHTRNIIFKELSMPVDRKLWTSFSFTKNTLPTLQCPTCTQGILEIKPKTISESSDKYSEQGCVLDNWENEFWSGRFCCLLKCLNSGCKDTVAALGIAEKHIDDEGKFFNKYYPASFYPPLLIFNIPEACPDDVAQELKAAFALFWSDLAGAMNHLRKSVELILTHLNIPKEQINKKGNSYQLMLHRRIEMFEKINVELANRLEAVKWLGNVGSHSAEVTVNDFFDACDLLEDFIHTHFEKRGDHIRAIEKKVNSKFRRS